METKKSHPFEKAKKHADKKRARVDEDAHDSAQLDDKSKRPKKAHKSALDTSKPGVEAKKTGVIPAVSTLPVERKKVSDSTNPVKKKKKNVIGRIFKSQINSDSITRSRKKSSTQSPESGLKMPNLKRPSNNACLR